jgi:hypothetical protein
MALLVTLHYRDNNDHRAESRLHAPYDAIDAGAVAWALAAASVHQAAVSARIVKVEIARRLDTGFATPAGLLSDCKRSATLFYRNGDDTASFYLPSPLPMLPEATGPYAGLRITRASVGMLGLLPLVDGLLAGALDPVRRPYGDYFSVGSFGGHAQ